MEFRILLFICLLTLISGSFSQEVLMHDLTLINRVRDINIVSLYLWNSGGHNKGENLLCYLLHPDSSATFTIPSGKCNLLAFDELGNSYGVYGSLQKCKSDTIEIDLEYITFAIPNIDHGDYPFTLTNSISGFALDTLMLSSAQLNEDIIIDGFRLFSGNSMIIWLDEGIYSLNVIDQIGRTYSIENISLPSDSFVVPIVSSMISNPQPPIGIAGTGNGSLLIENCLPTAVITGLHLIPRNGSDGIFLDSIALQPGASVVLKLNPGNYSIAATDEFGAEYYISFEQQGTDIVRLPITNEYLQYDFSFPDSNLER